MAPADDERGEHTTHYADVAAHYDEHVFYNIEGPLVKWQLDVVFKKLDLQPGVHLVDIGGGTGGFTHELAKRLVAAGDKSPCVTLVEPSKEMLAKAKERSEPALELVLGDASTFCDGLGKSHSGDIPVDEAKRSRKNSVDRIMLKEVVHHIPEADRDEQFRKLYERLSPGGRIVIVTRPAVLSGYPFPEFFLKYWSENQPTPEAFEGLLRRAGFEVAPTMPEAFPLRIKKHVWYRMLQQKFWSWLTEFSDEQILAGIEELEKRFPAGEGVSEAEDKEAPLCFHENMLFIVGTKPVQQ